MIYFDKPYLTIRWDLATRTVIMEWKMFVDGEAFRNGLNTGLELLVEKGASHWLADLRNLGVITPDDQKWSNEVWFPKAVSKGIRVMAIVVPKSTIAGMSVDAIMKKAELNNRTLVTHYFDNVFDAREWLRA
jgi:hypothetical protein